MMISPEYYEETKKGAAAEAKAQLGTGQTNYNWWRNAINKVKQGEFEFDENDVMMQNIVGADINELAPIKGFNSYNFLVAKLAYKILSYKFLYK